MTQGRNAHRQGRAVEDVIHAILIQRRYWPQRQKVIGHGIYGWPLEVDFYLEDAPNFPDGLIIESKWQSSKGTVYEKFPYLVQNIRQCFPCPAIVMAGGGGAPAGAIDWLRSQVDGKLFAVMNLEEFLTWAMRHL